jgi:hypothetical protein
MDDYPLGALGRQIKAHWRRVRQAARGARCAHRRPRRHGGDRPLLEVSAPLRRTSDASADSPTKLYARSQRIRARK